MRQPGRRGRVRERHVCRQALALFSPCDARHSLLPAPFPTSADHASYDVLVNRRVVTTEADFLEDGEGSALAVPLPGGQACQIVAKVGPKGNCAPVLTYFGERVLSVEEQGADATETSEELLAASGVRAT